MIHELDCFAKKNADPKQKAHDDLIFISKDRLVAKESSDLCGNFDDGIGEFGPFVWHPTKYLVLEKDLAV